MQKKSFVIAGLLIFAVGAFYLILNFGRDDSKGIEAQNVKDLVQKYSASNIQNVSASITSRQLIVTGNNGRKTTYELPKDEFFVSIAPYVEETHPCAIHSLTGCQGELTDQEFNVHIEDRNGNVVLNESIHSLSNGFIDLWLPRDQTYNISIEYDGIAAQSVISTFDGDNTCITDIQLRDSESRQPESV